MKKLFLAFGLLIASIVSASAACTSPAVMHDFPGTSFNMSLGTNSGDGNCVSFMDAVPAGNLLNAINNPIPLNKNGTPTGQTGVTPGTPQTGTIVGANVDLTSINGVATPVGSGVQATALRMTLATDSPGIVTLGPASIANSIPMIPSSQYPGNNVAAANPITASNTGTTGATTATLAGVASKTTFICGFTITSDATAAIAGAATVTGTVTGTLNYIQNVGSATSAGQLQQTFNPCVPASGANTGIAVNSVAAGTGGNTAVTAWGYQL